jgi:hypothetical protein
MLRVRSPIWTVDKVARCAEHVWLPPVTAGSAWHRTARARFVHAHPADRPVGEIVFDNGTTSPTPCAPTIAEPAGAAFSLNLAPATGEVNGVYAITTDGALNVLLDFDANASIKDQGNQRYDLSPVLRLMSVS